MSPQWIVVIGLIIVVYFLFIKKRPAVQKPSKQDCDDDKKDTAPSNEMVECSTCGIYCELDDTVLSDSKYYCSNECLEKK